MFTLEQILIFIIGIFLTGCFSLFMEIKSIKRQSRRRESKVIKKAIRDAKERAIK